MNIKITLPDYYPIIMFPITLEFKEDCPFLIIQGTNGCGKSTIFQVLTGIKEAKTDPWIIIDNQERYSPTVEKKIIRYLPQVPEDALFSNLSVKDNIRILQLIYNIKKDNSIDVCTEIKAKPYQALWHLSVGQKKMLLLKMIIYSLPEVDKFGDKPIILLFDEPFAGLDKKNKELVFSEIVKLAKKYQSNQFKIVIIDHLNIKLENNNNKSEIELRDGIKIKIIPTTNISRQYEK